MRREANAAPGAGPGPLANLRVTLAVAGSLGLLAGFCEGLVDLTHRHYHAPLILCVTLVVDAALFLALGAMLWVLARLIGKLLPPAFTFYLLAAVSLYYVPTIGTNSRSFRWLALAVAMLAPLPVAAWIRQRNQSVQQAARRGFRWLATAAAVCLLAIPVSGIWAERQALASLPQIPPDAPNVVLVIIDTVRADHLSAYGYDRLTSPEIDRLARQGVLFDTAIAASSWTLPSHASMMTGVYSHVHRTDDVTDDLPADLPTLGSTFEEDGYRTAAFSANTFLFSRRQGFGRGFIHFGDFFESPTEALAQVSYVERADAFLLRRHRVQNFLGRQTAADINREALQWVDSDKRPFFLVLNYLDAHDPYVPPQPWRHKFSNHMRPGGLLDIGFNIFPKLAPAQVQDEMDAYDGGIAYADHELGLLVDALRQRGLLQNTLIVVTSDHGEAFGKHGFFDHANALYFPQIHVPLVFSWPGHVPAGVRVVRPVSTKDIGATILALIHSQAAGFSGESLASLWNGQANPNSWPLPISELARLRISPTFPDNYGSLASIMTPQMQYIVDPRLGVLLYNWKTDPTEKLNLYPEAQYRDLAVRLEQDLESDGARMYLPHPGPAPLPAGTATAARRLGH